MESMFRFERARVDPATRSVELDGEPQHLEPQAFDLLVHLIAHRDRVLPKPELLDEVWGDQFVSESALTTRIKEIRRAVGDDGSRQAVIKNYRGRGYRFVASVDTSPDGAPALTQPGLCGRDTDIARTLEALATAPVVTLVGPGGVGKTTLAMEVAARSPGEVVVLRLAPLVDPAAVVHALRSATGLVDAGPAEADLVAGVAALDALVVIDNCEHLVAEAARIVDAVAAHNGPVRMLATSRERLGVPGEQVLPIAPLGAEAAQELLVRRVRALTPDWAGAEEEVARLVELVDRLPLAIEMAAARLPAIGLDDLLDLLDDRLDLLRSTDRTVEQRHSTLPSLIEWSEHLLEPTARRLLAELSVFAGPVSAADIAAVVGAVTTELTAGPLADLVDRSLVVADTSERPTRYHLLETVRACVAPRRTVTVEARHADHVDALVRSADAALRGPDEAAAAHRMAAAGAEVRAAHRWAREHEPELAASISASLLHYAQERLWDEPAAWAQALLDTPGLAPEIVPTASAAVAFVASNRGEYDLAASLGQAALGGEDVRVRVTGHDTLANVGLYTGDLALAADHGARMRAIAEDNGDGTAWVLAAVAQVLADLYGGRLDAATERLSTARPPMSLSPTGRAWMAYCRGEVEAARGDLARAVASFDQAILLAEDGASEFAAGVARVSRLSATSRMTNADDALPAFAELLTLYRSRHNLTHGVTAIRNLVPLLVTLDRDEPAMTLLGALDDPAVKRTYGTESDAIDEAEEVVRSRRSSEQVDEWITAGAGRGPLWALDHAIGAISDR